VGRDRVAPSAPRADDELANALLVRRAVWPLRREPLVEMVVAHEYDVGAGVVERIPERAHVGERLVTRAEQRVMPVGEGAIGRMRGEVGSEPLLLRGARVAAADRPAGAVEHDDVPGAEVIA